MPPIWGAHASKDAKSTIGLTSPERMVSMKQLAIIAAIVMSGLTGFANPAHVQGETGFGWVCGLTFEGTSKGVQFIIGSFKTEAVGTLSCLNPEGTRYEQPVRITMRNRAFNAGIGAGYFEFKGVSAQLSLMNASPDMLMGEYYVAQGQVAFIGGVSVMTATKFGTPQLSMQIAIQANEGIGFHVGLNRMTIEAL
jgi:hypothetical protein